MIKDILRWILRFFGPLLGLLLLYVLWTRVPSILYIGIGIFIGAMVFMFMDKK